MSRMKLCKGLPYRACYIHLEWNGNDRCPQCDAEYKQYKSKCAYRSSKKRIESGAETYRQRKLRQFYSSQKWKDAREEALKNWCHLDVVDCSKGIITDDKQLQVHHVIELDPKDRVSWDNRFNWEEDLLIPLTEQNHRNTHDGLIRFNVEGNRCVGFWEDGKYYTFPRSLEEVYVRIEDRNRLIQM